MSVKIQEEISSQFGLHRFPFGNRKISLPVVILAGLIALAFIVRLDDLTDLPLDFHPTRQLWSALIARGMYYQDLTSIPEWKRQMAVTQWRDKNILEPRVMETLAVAGYRLAGEEALWIPRLLSILFWIAGGVPLFFLCRGLSNDVGGLFATALYLFLPYGIIASRSFQPEPLMISAMIFALWGLFHWYLAPSWGKALLAGVLLCLSIFIKGLILFPLLGGMIGLFVSSHGIRRIFRDPQVGCISVIALLPNFIYLYYGTFVGHFLEDNLNGRFFPDLLISPWFYVRWELKINQVIGHLGLALSLLGIIFHKPKPHRWMVIGLWVGYAIYGLLFNYQISTHDYYHLPLVPIVALSLAPLAGALFKRLLAAGSNLRWPRVALSAVLLVALGAMIWQAHRILHAVDYRGEVAKYANIQQAVDRKKKIIALDEDYGYRLAYWGWINARIWPSYGDLNYQQKLKKPTPEFRRIFSSLTSGMDYFVITWFDELDYQPELRAQLFGNYPVYAQREGYIIFDLKHPLPTR